MRILIANTKIPFTKGGSSFIADWLFKVFKEKGFNCEIINLPFKSHPQEIIQQMLAFRLFDLERDADLLITIRTPSYLLKHSNKIVWFTHHHRGAYDLWGTQFQDIPNTKEGILVKNSIIAADNAGLKECKKVFTNSVTVSNRLKKYNQLDSEVLYPPIYNPDRFFCYEYGDFIFYPSRITMHKRQNLAVEAMQYTKTGVKLLIAGSPDDAIQDHHIKNTINRSKMKEKITIIPEWISDSEKVSLFSKCLAGIYIPYEEDSYGYPTLEAFHSKKPVITCSDSGGTLEIIEDGENGMIVDPTPQSIAYAMDSLYLNKQKAKIMGEKGILSISQKNINFDHVIQRMIS